MQFENVIGQKAIKEHLVQMAQHNRLSHALLFLGKEGNGSLSLALAFAQYIVCEKNSPFKRKNALASAVNSAVAAMALFNEPPAAEIITETNNQQQLDSCGTCPSCRWFIKQRHCSYG